MEDAIQDEAWDAAWEHMSKELYPEHREQAIEEFTDERLKSFYMQHSDILLQAVKRFEEADELHESHPSASLVFSTTAIELYLKSSLLKPVVYGLIHNEALADIVVATALGQTGFERYKKLLSKLFEEIAGIDIGGVKRAGSTISLLSEVKKVQDLRNAVIHRGEDATAEQARFAMDVATCVLYGIVNVMLYVLGLKFDDDGYIVKTESD